jgi:tripartite-type tricarboxylate transporter receptor subunit TctC
MSPHMNSASLRALALLTASIPLLVGNTASGQSYPVKPVRLIIGGLPGTAPDVIARVMQPHVEKSLGQPLVIDNRGGGAGVLAGQITAAAPADGYTALLTGGGGMTIVPFLTRKRPYDPVGDFTTVTLVTIAPLVFASHPSLPVKSVQELIALAKAKPKELLFASPGVGSIHHLSIEMFNRGAGVTMVHVPYKGGPPAVLDAIGGRVHLVVTTVIPSQVQVKAGKLRAIGVTSLTRVSVYPDVPTMSESGLQGFEALQWFAMFAPRNTPAALRERLFAEARKAVEIPSVAAALAEQGQDLAVNGPQALADFQRSEIAKWHKIIVHLRESGTVFE